MERRDTSYNEYLESNTITLEWTLRGLKQLFDSSKGEAKSKVTRSVKFGGGRWQILFYPNSGVTSDGGGYVSLYLSCEPTAEEKAGAINGKWVREGLYKFSFELRNVNKGTLFNTKEAVDHAFSHQTANWGWAQFAKREVVYYSASAVRLQDAFLIICTITSSPTPPIPPSAIPRQLVPRDLLNAVGAILDDPAYSDVEFVLPARANGGRARHIWANRKLLSRAEYFSTMFSSGFAEGISVGNDHSLSIGRSESPGHSQVDDDDSRDMTSAFVTGYPDDSDEDDDDIDDMVSEADFDESESGAETIGVPAELPDIGRDEGIDLPGTTSLVESSRSSKKRKIAHSSHQPPGPPKTKVIVHDVAYATYKAFLYYLYTDSIVFAPLSSNFLISSARQEEAPSLRMSASAASLGLLAKPGEASNMKSQSVPMPSSQSEGSKTRKAWVAEWQASNPDRPGPCSAKAIYRLADSTLLFELDLHDLKARAFQHITKSLTTTNVPYEIFSSFSAHFDEVRKVEVDFFLSHWEEIKGSDAMRHIFHQIRNGRHPGFEDVWPYIVTNLVYKPGHIDTASGDAAEG